MLELKYTKGPAAYGSVNNIQKSKNLNPRLVKLFHKAKNAHAKHYKYRKKIPTLKNIACDINEIYSLDLAFMDKLKRRTKM